MSTIAAYYKRLETQDNERFLELNGILAARKHKRKDCLKYLTRSIIEKEVKENVKIDLPIEALFLADLFVEYFGWTMDNIRANYIPPVTE